MGRLSLNCLCCLITTRQMFSLSHVISSWREAGSGYFLVSDYNNVCYGIEIRWGWEVYSWKLFTKLTKNKECVTDKLGAMWKFFRANLGSSCGCYQITYWVVLKYLQEFKFWIRVFSSSLTTLALKTTPNLEYIKCHQMPGEFVL